MKMNLQLFAKIFDPGTEPDYPNPLLGDWDEPLEAESAPEGALEDPAAGEPEELLEETPEETLEEPLAEEDMAVETEEDVVEDEPEFDLNSYLSEIQSSIAELNDKLESRGQEEKQVSEEELKAAMEAENEEFWQKMQSNPKEAVMELAKQIAEEEIRPLREKYEAQEREQLSEKQVQAFMQEHPDMDEYASEMYDILEARPYLLEQDDALEVAYKMAKADGMDRISKAKPTQTPDELLKDEAFIEKIMQDPEIKKRIMAANLQEIDKGKPPAVIGAEKSGGKSALTQPNRPTDIKQASKLLYESLKQQS